MVGVCDLTRLRTACRATETSWNIEIMHAASLHVVPSILERTLRERIAAALIRRRECMPYLRNCYSQDTFVMFVVVLEQDTFILA